MTPKDLMLLFTMTITRVTKNENENDGHVFDIILPLFSLSIPGTVRNAQLKIKINKNYIYIYKKTWGGHFEDCLPCLRQKKNMTKVGNKHIVVLKK